jgi:hypothetical protein
VAWKKGEDEIKVVRVYKTVHARHRDHSVSDALEGLHKRLKVELEQFKGRLVEGMVVRGSVS